ncbi:hypothetical protein NEF87_000110 [Candidatus Lokiarchaeum ossiferum]|uniref:Bulb-type lectin domain-containing protein n=1 Tax=Candidatus Lokiarchaeum ossiferum TaxID=2951803 RepID=A0ABY6HJW9_9ARCH|nr:hypothetical protein NEF87_000110 [Candidatus Lokiarchaeum sp. B-35]
MIQKTTVQKYLFGALLFGSLVTLLITGSVTRENGELYFLNDSEAIFKGNYSGSFLIAQQSGNISVLSENQEILWNLDLNSSEIRDVDILPNGNFLIADYSNDCILEINPSNNSEIVWMWDALNPQHINWSDYAIFKNWSTPVRAFLNGSQGISNPWTGISEVQFIEGSQFNRNFDSILITLSLFDMVIEIKYSSTPSILWSYGIPGYYSQLQDPIYASYLSSGNIIISDSGNHRLLELHKTWHYLLWTCKVPFPEGNMHEINDIVEVNATHLLISDSQGGKIKFLNKTSKSFEQELTFSNLMNPYDLDRINNSLYITDIDNIYRVSLLNYNVESLFTTQNYLKPFYIIMGMGMLYHCLLLGYESIYYYNQEVRCKIIRSPLRNRLIILGLCTLVILLLPDIVSFYLNFESLI